MPRSTGFGLGGFLVGLGVGWLIFTIFEISLSVLAWILIVAGIGIVASALIWWQLPNLPARGLVGALLGGLVLSLFLTTGIGLVQGIVGGGGPWLYRAEGTKSFSGAVTNGRVYFEVDNINGLVRVSTWERAEYRIDLAIRAGGSSQADAEASLASFKVNLDESLNQDQKRLVLKYDVPLLAYSRYAIGVEVLLPRGAVIGLDLESSNGGIYLTDIRGDVLKMSTSNGPLEIRNVYADSMNGRTSNGRVEGTLQAKDTVLTTSNGRIELRVPSTVSGRYDLRTSNAPIGLEVSSWSQVGYSLDLSTSNANININLPNLSYGQNLNTAKKAQTVGFSTKPVQLTIRGETSNGNINVNTFSP